MKITHLSDEVSFLSFGSEDISGLSSREGSPEMVTSHIESKKLSESEMFDRLTSLILGETIESIPPSPCPKKATVEHRKRIY